MNARSTLETVRNLAQYLGNIRGRRKAIVLFSEGIDYNIYDVMGTVATEASVVMDATRDLLSAATRANVAVYGVDPRGLGASFDDLAGLQSFPDDTSLGLGQSALFNEVRLGQDSLRVLSDETGGTIQPAARLELTVVPVPAALWLLGSGVAVLMGLRRRN